MADIKKIVVYYDDNTFEEMETVKGDKKKKLKELAETSEPQLLLEVEPKGAML